MALLIQNTEHSNKYVYNPMLINYNCQILL